MITMLVLITLTRLSSATASYSGWGWAWPGTLVPSWSVVMMMLMITMMIVTGGSVFQEEAGAGGDLPGVGEWPGDLRHVELGEVGHQGDWLEAGPAGDQVTLTQIGDDG